ncbi:MAG: heme-dependent oxidative N-demethylase subunit alpha family protein, partial [Acetobacteraceae bacterium]
MPRSPDPERTRLQGRADQPPDPANAWQRLDTWLWCARFLRSRADCARLVMTGGARVNRQPTDKPHARVRMGDVLTLALRGAVRVVRVRALAARRGPAAEARTLYEEVPEPDSELPMVPNAQAPPAYPAAADLAAAGSDAADSGAGNYGAGNPGVGDPSGGKPGVGNPSDGLPPEAVYLPFAPGPYRMAMGLTACPEADWIERDERYPEEMALRRALLAERHDEVFGALAASAAARRETLALLAAHLPARFPDGFARTGRTLRNLLTGEAWNLADPPVDPLELAGRLVQEDLCLVRLDETAPKGTVPGAAVPVLDAAVLCFPSRWRLADKLGLPLAAVHSPVPLYAERLARPVDRFMTALKPGHVALRLNWALVDDPTLFQPTGKFRAAHDPRITAGNAGTQLWLRVERQTLRRLPDSGTVLFAIRVHAYALARIAAPPHVAARLAAAVR